MMVDDTMNVSQYTKQLIVKDKSLEYEKPYGKRQ